LVFTQKPYFRNKTLKLKQKEPFLTIETKETQEKLNVLLRHGAFEKYKRKEDGGFELDKWVSLSFALAGLVIMFGAILSIFWIGVKKIEESRNEQKSEEEEELMEVRSEGDCFERKSDKIRQRKYSQ
jgi:hypothetical protein